jgi:RNA polymerase sigma factor (sigma-70 family)
MRAGSRLARLDDERLAALVGRGDAAAFETLYDRHHAALLAFCRHLTGNRHDGEDALQQAFLRAHRALADGRAPDRVRPWLFAIARNRCLTLLAARRDAAVPIEEVEPSFDGLSSDVERRADLRELVSDLSRLPDDQRGALVLAELGDFSHSEIAQVIGCSPAKVKALVFQGRTTLIADRDARHTPCEDIRTLLETARGGLLRRGPLRRHLRQCDPCAAYRHAIEGRRSGLALVLPVAPTAGLKGAVLGGVGGGLGGAESAAVAASLVAPGSLGVASTAAGGIAAKVIVAKVAVAVAIGAGAAGGAVAVHERVAEEPVRLATVEQRSATVRPATQALRQDEPSVPVSDIAPAAAGSPIAPVRLRRVVARLRRTSGRADVRRVRRRIRRLTQASAPADVRRVRRAIRRRLTPDSAPADVRRVRRTIRRRLVQAGTEVPRNRPGVGAKPGVIVGSARPPRVRRHPAPLPAPTVTPTVTPEPVEMPEPQRRRRKRPEAAPTPVPTAEPVPTPAPAPEPTATPTATPTPAP